MEKSKKQKKEKRKTREKKSKEKKIKNWGQSKLCMILKIWGTKDW